MGLPFEVHVISTDAYSPEGVRRLEEQGVTDAIVGFRWPYQTGPDRSRWPRRSVSCAASPTTSSPR